MKKVSERGVYYDLSLSPYAYEHPYNETIYKFQSAKKLDMYIKHIAIERVRFQKIIAKLDFLTTDEKLDINFHMERRIYDKVYVQVTGVVIDG